MVAFFFLQISPKEFDKLALHLSLKGWKGRSGAISTSPPKDVLGKSFEQLEIF
jgi:hypothetical protein